MKREPLAIVLVTLCVTAAPIAFADPPMTECANHTHVWSKDQCEENNPNSHGPYGFPGGGNGGGGGGGGLLGAIHRATHGLL